MIRTMKTKHRASRRRAFSLVEVTMALGVVSFCLLALCGLLPIGLRTNQASVEQTVANGIFSSVIADLRATPMASGTLSGTSTQQFAIPIPAGPTTPGTSTLYFTGDGQVTSSQSLARYLLTVTFVSNKSSTVRTATLANMVLSWPAAANPSLANGSAQTFVALDRN